MYDGKYVSNLDLKYELRHERNSHLSGPQGLGQCINIRLCQAFRQ